MTYLIEVQVQVGNTNEWLINWLLFQYGGCVCKRKAKKDNWKDSWEWKLQTRQALRFLEIILPYLKIKKPQAELAISFGKRRKIGKKTEAQMAVDEAQRIVMLGYNRKGK